MPAPGRGSRRSATRAGSAHWPTGPSWPARTAVAAARAWTTARAAASSSGVGFPRTTLSIATSSYLQHLPHSGMLPCFFGGSSSRLLRSVRRA